MSDREAGIEARPTARLWLLDNATPREQAEAVHWLIQQGLRAADSCGIARGLETEYQVVPAESVPSWLADDTRRHRFLFVADRNTTVEDVEWQLRK